MKNILQRVSYADVIFYFLTISLFVVFLMPFMPYSSLNLVDVSSGGQTKYLNDTMSANIYLFKYRYYIFYYTLCVASVAILSDKRLIAGIVDLYRSFSKILQVAIVVFFVFGIISSAFAISPSIAFKGVSVTFLQFFCIMFIANYVRDNFSAVRLFYTIILLSIIFLAELCSFSYL